MDAPKRVVITCRSNDYLDPSQSLKLQNIPVVSVDDLNKEQIERFVQNYLGDKADTFMSRLGKTMKVHERVSDDEKNAHSLSVLARNPYFLRALIYLFQDSSETDLPYNVGTLFQRLSSALWAREQKRSPQRLPEFSDVERAFGRLAFSMIDEETPFDVSQAYALKKMFPSRLRFGMHNERAKQILQVGEHCNFILISGDQVRFYHQLIQEYFASLELKYQRTLKELPKPQQDSLAGPYGLYGTRSSYKWDEVIVSLAGITTKNVDDFVKTLVNYDPYLVAKVIASGVQVSHGVREAVMPEIIKYDGPYYAVGVSARILAEIGESTAIPHVVKLLSHHNFMRVVIGAKDALRIYGSQAVPALIEELKSSSPYVRANCVYVLGEIGDARAVPHLIGLLSDREHGVYGIDLRVCDAVARALLSIATPEAKTAVLTWQRDLITTILSQGKDVDDDALRSIDALIAVKDHKTHFALLELLDDNFHLILVQIIHHLIQVIQDESNQEYKEISRLNARVRVLASIIVKLSNPISLHSLELLSDYKYFEVRDALTYSETPEAKALLEVIENRPKG
ncbi:MAG: HEAT repeat domain-containing protein [Anaerolinea sp.]|nr:HEAT repeat domain-containing protein [Anaerolinea sp.]